MARNSSCIHTLEPDRLSKPLEHICVHTLMYTHRDKPTYVHLRSQL